MSNIELKDCSLLTGYPSDVNVVKKGGKEVSSRPAFYGSYELS